MVALLALFVDLGAPPGAGVRAGDPAPGDLRAPRDLQLVDEAQTEARRSEARSNVPEVYVYDRTHGDRLAADLAKLVDRARTGEADGLVSEAVLAALRNEATAPDVADTMTGAVRRAMNQKVVSNRALLVLEPAILLREMPGSGRDDRVTDYDGFIGLADAQRIARTHVLEMLPGRLVGREDLAALAASFVDANVTPDPRGTLSRRAQAAAAVQPVKRAVVKGELLVKEGEPVPGDVVAALESDGRLTVQGVAPFFGLLTVVSLVAFFLYRYTRYHQRNFDRLPHLHALFVLLMLCLLLLAQAMLWLAHGLTDDLRAPFNAPDLYMYLFPVAAGAILVALLANGRIAMVYSAFTALLFGILADWDMFLAPGSCSCSGPACMPSPPTRTGRHCCGPGSSWGRGGRPRRGPARAGRPPGPTSATLYAATLAFVGGAVGVGLLVSFLLPVLERLFGVLTDVRLLELSDANHPLL